MAIKKNPDEFKPHQDFEKYIIYELKPKLQLKLI